MDPELTSIPKSQNKEENDDSCASKRHEEKGLNFLLM